MHMQILVDEAVIAIDAMSREALSEALRLVGARAGSFFLPGWLGNMCSNLICPTCMHMSV